MVLCRHAAERSRHNTRLSSVLLYGNSRRLDADKHRFLAATSGHPEFERAFRVHYNTLNR